MSVRATWREGGRARAWIGTAILGVIAIAAGRGASATDEVRCRCEPLDLADYWEVADEVALARLVSFEEVDTHFRFRMVLEAGPWKVAATRGPEPLARGDTVAYRTPVSTATCGVPPEPGAVYVLFGRASSVDGVPDVDTCSGTRIHRAPSLGDELGGFRDVPGRFLVRRLDALGGLEALKGLAALPDAADATSEVPRGLLDLEPLAHGGVIRIFEHPDVGSRVLARVDAPAALVTREVDYEVAAAVVFARVRGWSRVSLADGGAGWIAPEESGTWFPWEDLPVGRLAYLTPAWSGYLWPDPGAGIPFRVERTVPTTREQPARVLESTVLGGAPWFRVAVLETSPCDGPDRARPVAGGWVPGYRVPPPDTLVAGTLADSPGVQPTVWYWSRGC